MTGSLQTRYVTCTILWLCRLWPRYAAHWCWQDLLYVLRCLGHPSDTGHVPEPGREDQHFSPLPPAQSQARPGPTEDGGIHGEHGPGGSAVMHEHAVYRSRSLLPLRGLDFLQCLLLLLHHAHHHRLWRFCGAAEDRCSPEATPLCRVQLHVHFGRADSNWGFS